ncbi:MAG: glutathione S-transferase family protein [Pseudomonadota bacterium]|nr:glutathione S-transferase family protein [Pseudomonadota bacterium]
MAWYISLILLLTLALIAYVREKGQRRTRPVSGGKQSDVDLPYEKDIELYANPFSHCSRKVTLAMEEYELDYAYHNVHLIETGWYETISRAFLAINPSGLVPVLVHEGTPVYESDDILLYLETLTDKQSIIPPDATGQKVMKEWIEFCSVSSKDPMSMMDTQAGACVPALTLPIFATMISEIDLRHILTGFLFHPDKVRPLFFLSAKLLGLGGILKTGPAGGLIDRSRDAMLGHMETINKALKESGGPWILGEQFSLADISLASIYLRLDETGWFEWFMGQSDLNAIAAHYAQLKARPSWQNAIEEKQLDIVKSGRKRLLTLVQNSPAIRRKLYGS